MVWGTAQRAQDLIDHVEGGADGAGAGDSGVAEEEVVAEDGGWQPAVRSDEGEATLLLRRSGHSASAAAQAT